MSFECRYDTRGEEKSYEEARHWSDDKVLTGRAFFRGDHDPGRLILDNVASKDQGSYKCRVDFRKAPTRISNVRLNVIGNFDYYLQSFLITSMDLAELSNLCEVENLLSHSLPKSL